MPDTTTQLDRLDEAARGRANALRLQVADTRRRVRRNAVLAGFALTVAAMVGWLLLAAAVDMLVPLPVPLRTAAWAVFWLLGAAGVALTIFWPAVRPMPLEGVAFRIERALGGMHNRLVSVLDLHRAGGSTSDRSLPFAERLVAQTADRMTGYRTDAVADPGPVQRMTLAAAGVVALALVLGVGLDARLDSAVRRLLLPTRPIPPVTSVRLTAHPGDVSVLQGRPVRLWADAEGDPVESLTLRLRPDGGQWLEYPMRREADGTFAFTLDAVTASCTYEVVGGGTWTLPHRITMVRRPVVENLSAEVLLPEYMGLPEPRPVEPGADRIRAPVGSRVRLRARVSGDVADGVIRVFRAIAEEQEQTEQRETVWLDDHLPPDAEETGPWTWLEDPVFSGTRAHTFTWDRTPYGFRTRLNRLTVAAGEAFFLFVRPDASEPAGRLTVRVSAGNTTVPLVWDSPRAPLAEADRKKVRYVGALPPAGDWHRLQVPIETLLGSKPKKPVALDGLTFEIDAGRIHLDRAGKVKRVTRALAQTQLEEVGTVPMTREPESDLWTGEVTVAEDRSVTVAFRNALGHPSPSMKAIPVVATEDRPPTVVCERPGKSLTVPDAEPVPLMVRAFDDFGLEAVRLETGPSADAFTDSRVLAEYDRPAPTQSVMASLAPSRLGLKPGTSVYYRVLARDRKGQEVASEPYRLGLAEPKDDQAPEAARGRIAAGQFLDDIDRLTDTADDLRSAVGEILATRPGSIALETDAAGALRLANVVGVPLTGDEIRDLLAKWNDHLTDEQRRHLAEIRTRTARERQRLLDLAEGFRQAADDAEGSVYELPLEADALRAMADRARDLADTYPEALPGEGLDQAVLARLMALDELLPDQQAELEALARQFEELTAARTALGEEGLDAQQQYGALLAQIQGRQMFQQMSGLQDYLQSQQEYLRQMRDQVAALRQKTPEGDADTLEGVSARQQELDPEALQLLRRAQELLRKRAARAQESRLALPPAPWVPPGRREMRAPVEADTPEEARPSDAPSDAAGPDLDAVRRRLDELEEAEDMNWWDRPVDSPPDAYTLEANERYADRHRTAPPPGEAPAGGWTPRRLLQDHQDRLYQALTENSNRMAAAQDDLSRVMGQLDQAMSGPLVSGVLSPEAARSLQETLGSRATSQIMGMLNQAALQMAEGAFVPQSLGAAGEPFRTNPARPGMVLSVDLGDVPDDQAPTLYRLPPRLRQPLVEGMQERGPEAYQPLIQAYYRQLSDDVQDGGAGAEAAPQPPETKAVPTPPVKPPVKPPEKKAEPKPPVKPPEKKVVPKPPVKPPETKAEPKPPVKPPETKAVPKPPVKPPEKKVEPKPPVKPPETKAVPTPPAKPPEKKAEPKPPVKLPEKKVEPKAPVKPPETKAVPKPPVKPPVKKPEPEPKKVEPKEPVPKPAEPKAPAEGKKPA